jgi:hypothetical protein
MTPLKTSSLVIAVVVSLALLLLCVVAVNQNKALVAAIYAAALAMNITALALKLLRKTG